MAQEPLTDAEEVQIGETYRLQNFYAELLESTHELGPRVKALRVDPNGVYIEAVDPMDEAGVEPGDETWHDIDCLVPIE